MNHEPKKECFKTSVGGQALMEGIMMRGPEHICCAVRKPDGTIETKIEDTPKHGIWAKIPLVRGAISMIESLITGYRYMMYSAQVSMGDEYDAEEEESAFEKWVGDHLGKKAEDILMAGAALVGGLFAILLFTVLPTVLVGGLGKVVILTRWPRVILEAVLKVAIFLSYMVAISKMKEIHRVFEYHGAEHKTIACYEAGDELTVENVRKYTRFHPRCGTSFLILVVIVSVFLYSVLPWSSTSLRVLFKLLLLPVVMGISYELLKWCGRSDNIATRIIRQPGLWVQRLTVFEPDDSMIEVAIAAVTPVTGRDVRLSDRPLDAAEAAKLEELTVRRAAREPLQYLCGSWPFLDFELAVGPGVLCPRADTEVVAETAAEMLAGVEAPRALDLCAGTGCLGLGVKRLCPAAQVVCVEKSPEAYVYLEKNTRLALKGRGGSTENVLDASPFEEPAFDWGMKPTRAAEPVEGDLFTYWESLPEGQLDLIVSNPPYLTAQEMGELQPEVAKEPAMALEAGEDGLVFYKAIAEHYQKALRPGGALALEIGWQQREAVTALLEANGWADIACRKDFGGNDRCVTARRPK